MAEGVPALLCRGSTLPPQASQGGGSQIKAPVQDYDKARTLIRRADNRGWRGSCHLPLSGGGQDARSSPPEHPQ